MNITNSVYLLAIIATPIHRAHLHKHTAGHVHSAHAHNWPGCYCQHYRSTSVQKRLQMLYYIARCVWDNTNQSIRLWVIQNQCMHHHNYYEAICYNF